MSTSQTGIKSISTFMNGDAVKEKFKSVLGEGAASFITSIITACNQNEELKKATTESIYSASLMAATLKLSVNPNLGHAYLIPFTSKKGTPQETTECQFIGGYKGLIQLAQRSGQFITIGATHITDKDKRLGNRLVGHSFDFSDEVGVVVGYAAYFELTNGFKKTYYMSVDELKKHGTKFSQTFKRGFGLWKDDFDSMATKTVIKLLLTKYAPLAVDTPLQRALVVDQAVINDVNTLDVSYVDNDETEKPSVEEHSNNVQKTRILEAIGNISKEYTSLELQGIQQACGQDAELLQKYSEQCEKSGFKKEQYNFS